MTTLHTTQRDRSPEKSSEAENRFHGLFEQAPISMQLLAADGRTLQVNKAFEKLWHITDENAVKEYILSAQYNVLTDPQLHAKGITPFLKRAFSGESVKIPAVYYDPAEMGKPGRARWVTATAHPITNKFGTVQEVMLMHEDITEQVESQRLLLESEERFRSLVTATSIIVWTTDAEGMAIEDSPSWRAFTGQTFDQWKNGGWTAAVHPDDRDNAAKAFNQSIANKTIYRTEYRLRRADGSYCWTAATAAPVLNTDGSVKVWVGANTDITNAMEAINALQASDARFRTITDAMPQMVWSARPDGSIEYFSQQWYDFTGVPFGSTDGEGWEHIVHPEEQDATWMAWTHSLQSGEPYEMQYRLRHRSGHYRWALARAVPVRDDAGKIILWMGTCTDIHDQKQIEAELAKVNTESKRRRRLYETFLENTPDLAYVFDLSHRFTYANKVLLTLWGKTWDEAIGKNCLELGYEPWHADMHSREIEQVKATKQPIKGEVPFAGSFGRRIYEYIFVPVIGPDGEVEAIAGTTRDVTERKEHEDSLEEGNRRKDEFLAMLAHELRNPLAPISAAAELLTLPQANEKFTHQASQIITRQVAHMTTLVNDLLDVSRVTRGLIELESENLDLKVVINSAIEQARPLIEARQHELRLRLTSSHAYMKGDKTRLVQVLVNLLTNAAKYTPQGGRIELALDVASTHAAVSVCDNGAGIESSLLPRIFDLFAQGERTPDRSQGGLGLGLALVKNLTALHGGKVDAYSDGLGKGSRFTLTLPLLEQNDVYQSEFKLEPIDLQRIAPLRLMIVDDNLDAAKSLASLLEASGHGVTVCEDGEKALQAIAHEAPQVCILDIGLPDMDGYELARQLRANPATAQAVMIALTGYGQAHDRVLSKAAGFDHHFVKPINTLQLAQILSQVAQ